MTENETFHKWQTERLKYYSVDVNLRYYEEAGWEVFAVSWISDDDCIVTLRRPWNGRIGREFIYTPGL